MISSRIQELRDLAATGAQGKKSAAIVELCDAIVACQRRREKNIGPTIHDCFTYGEEIGLNLDEATSFHDYHTARGWKMGKTASAPMRDWKAALRLWARNCRQKQSAPRRSYGIDE
jgi:hypothetical protein